MPLTAALARCDRELAEIDAREDRDRAPAYLVAMGRFDWERERRLIEQEMGRRNEEGMAGLRPRLAVISRTLRRRGVRRTEFNSVAGASDRLAIAFPG